jgi:glycosyltransferase involved in cell wall biosynthesis
VKKMSANPKIIYLACPWHPFGGGMFKVTDYLVQYQSLIPSNAELRPLDTRGGGHVAHSIHLLPRAMMKVLWALVSGRLGGVHVNMAERASALRKGALVVLSRMIGARVLIHLHAAQMHHVFRAMPAPGKAALRLVFRCAHEVIVLGEVSRQFVIDELGCDPPKVHVVTNGVPDARVPRRDDEVSHCFQILFLGNLLERKGVTDLLQALARVVAPRQSWHATFAGGGDVDGYRAKANALGLSANVTFFGWARQEEGAQLLANADLLALPSYDEGLPLVILEALANGVAVLCTPVGEIPSTLARGVDAEFVEPGDVEGIARCIDALIADPLRRRALERQGRALYEQRFSIRAFFDAVGTVHHRTFGVRAQFDPAGHARGHGA